MNCFLSCVLFAVEASQVLMLSLVGGIIVSATAFSQLKRRQDSGKADVEVDLPSANDNRS